MKEAKFVVKELGRMHKAGIMSCKVWINAELRTSLHPSHQVLLSFLVLSSSLMSGSRRSVSSRRKMPAVGRD